jgi:hypothetical protein
MAEMKAVVIYEPGGPEVLKVGPQRAILTAPTCCAQGAPTMSSWTRVLSSTKFNVNIREALTRYWR